MSKKNKRTFEELKQIAMQRVRNFQGGKELYAGITDMEMHDYRKLVRYYKDLLESYFAIKMKADELDEKFRKVQEEKGAIDTALDVANKMVRGNFKEEHVDEYMNMLHALETLNDLANDKQTGLGDSKNADATDWSALTSDVLTLAKN